MMHLRRWVVVQSSLMVFLIVCPAVAQNPLLQITSPANQALVSEGQTLTITVSADPSVQNVWVMAQNPLPEVQPTLNATQFTLNLPTNLTPGVYQIAAIGNNASGPVQSASVLIDVERQDAPISISIQPQYFTIQGIGVQTPIPIYGTYADGTSLNLSYSTQTGLVSSNTAIATVSGTTSSSPGMASPSAVGAGETSVVVSTYATGSTCVIMRTDDDSRLANEFARSFLRRYAPQRLPPKPVELSLAARVVSMKKAIGPPRR